MSKLRLVIGPILLGTAAGGGHCIAVGLGWGLFQTAGRPRADGLQFQVRALPRPRIARRRKLPCAGRSGLCRKVERQGQKASDGIGPKNGRGIGIQ
jgi:hypothetical protein